MFLRQNQKYEAAEQQFIASLQLRPTYYDALFEYGSMLCQDMEHYDLGLYYLQTLCSLSSIYKFQQTYVKYKLKFSQRHKVLQ